MLDGCRTSRNSSFVSSATNDYDGDGCEDAGEDTDDDNDGVDDGADVDDDNDGLIEIATAEELDNIRHQLDGTRFKINAGDTGSLAGCSAADPVGCNGYELIGDIDILAALVSSAVSNFEPIGPLGSPFTAIFEGNKLYHRQPNH